MPLSDSQVRSARCAAGDSETIIADNNGLFLVITPTGTKLWRSRFRHQLKQIKVKLGDYPSVSLAKARLLNLELRAKHEAGFDATAQTAQTAQSVTFAAAFDHWFNQWSPGKADRTTFYAQRRFDAHVRPKLGNTPVATLRAKDLINLALALEATDRPEVARRTLAICSQVLQAAVVHEWVPFNPIAGIKDRQIFREAKEKNYARLEIDEFPAFLRALDGYDGSARVRYATLILAYTFVRTGELIQARWNQIDTSARLWVLPPEVMKTARRHCVPLAPQVVDLLHRLREANERKYGHSGVQESSYLFPGDRDAKKMLSNNTILAVIDNLGYKGRMTGHGFRGIASTALNEAGFRTDVIESQLAHVQEKVRGAYNHAQYLPERFEMMGAWANAIDQMRQTQGVPDTMRGGAALRRVTASLRL